MSAEVRVQLLSHESEPQDLLHLGAGFEVFEGPRVVAMGIVVSAEEAGS